MNDWRNNSGNIPPARQYREERRSAYEQIYDYSRQYDESRGTPSYDNNQFNYPQQSSSNSNRYGSSTSARNDPLPHEDSRYVVPHLRNQQPRQFEQRYQQNDNRDNQPQYFGQQSGTQDQFFDETQQQQQRQQRQQRHDQKQQDRYTRRPESARLNNNDQTSQSNAYPSSGTSTPRGGFARRQKTGRSTPALPPTEAYLQSTLTASTSISPDSRIPLLILDLNNTLLFRPRRSQQHSQVKPILTPPYVIPAHLTDSLQ